MDRETEAWILTLALENYLLSPHSHMMMQQTEQLLEKYRGEYSTTRACRLMMEQRQRDIGQ